MICVAQMWPNSRCITASEGHLKSPNEVNVRSERNYTEYSCLQSPSNWNSARRGAAGSSFSLSVELNEKKLVPPRYAKETYALPAEERYTNKTPCVVFFTWSLPADVKAGIAYVSEKYPEPIEKHVSSAYYRSFGDEHTLKLTLKGLVNVWRAL